jgi:hypothetical protein
MRILKSSQRERLDDPVRAKFAMVVPVLEALLLVLGIEPVREPQVTPADPWTIERWHLDMVSPGWQRIDVRGRVSDLQNPYQPMPPPHKCIIEVVINGQALASL